MMDFFDKFRELMLLQIVSGEPPFGEISTDFQAVTATLKGERPKRDAHPGIEQLGDPDALWQLLDSCWAHDERKRPHMSEVVMRFRGIKEQNHQLHRRDPPVVPQPHPRRRRQTQ